jgi:hypothetical protein
MTTVAQVAKASLQRILVQASEAPLEADEYQDFLFAMNNYMTDLAAKGVNLGYTVVADLADTITIPDGAIRGLIANMAVEVAPDYGVQISEALARAASEGMVSMRMLGQTMAGSRYPSTLPMGSGNEGVGSLNISSHFYPEMEDSILAEGVGTIALEINTDG